MRAIRRWRAPVALAVLLCMGCAGSPTPYTAKDAASRPNRAMLDGVLVVVDSLTDPDRCKRHFGGNLLDHDILPVFVLVENHGPTRVTLQRRNVTIVGQNDMDDWDRRRVRASAAAGGLYSSATAIAVAGVFFPPLLLAWIPAYLWADKIGRDRLDVVGRVEASAFADATLGPRESASGFIFFDRKEVKGDLQDLTVEVVVSDLDTHETRSVVLPLAPKVGSP